MLQLWYARVDLEEVLHQYKDQLKRGRYKATEGLLAKARKRDSTQALSKLTTMVDGQWRIVSDPPLVVPVEEIFPDIESAELYDEVRTLIAGEEVWVRD